MLRRSLLVAAVALLAACSDCNSPCKEGITFYVSELAGSLAPGSPEQLNICFDGGCQTVSMSRKNAASPIFLPFSGVGKDGDHHVTVSGSPSVNGDYTGPINAFEQHAGGSCDSCAVGAFKVGADGTLTPGTAVVPSTTTPAPATTGG